MARWTPKYNDPVKLSEHVGRRLFDEPLLSGAPDQKRWEGLDLRHFIESREDRQFSLDRLGETGVNKRVVNYLLPRCSEAAKKFATPQRFDGWAYASVRSLLQGAPMVDWEVVPSPVTGCELAPSDTQWADNQLEQNLYHAHIPMPDGLDSYDFGLKLRQKFVRHGDVLETERRKPEEPQISGTEPVPPGQSGNQPG
jgi:hypothetical protein